MTDKKTRNLSLVFGILAYSIFGFSFLFSKQALEVADTFVLLAVRFVVAFGIMSLGVLFRIFKVSLKGKNVKLLLLLGLVQPVIYFVFETYGIALTPTSFVGTMLALIPVATLIMGIVFLKEKATVLQAVFALVSVAGVFLTTLGQASGSVSLLGLVLLLGAVCSAAAFNIISRKTSGEFSAFERTYVMFGLGAIVFTGIALVRCRGNYAEMLLKPLSDGGFWVSIFFLSLISSVIAFMMINFALTHLDAAKASIFSNLTTVVSILAGVLILGEPFSLYQVVGSVVIIFSVYMVSRPAKQKEVTNTQEK